MKNYLKSDDFTNLKSKQNEINDLIIEKIIAKVRMGEVLNTAREREDKFTFSLIKFVKIYNLRDFLFSSSRSEKELLLEFKKILKLTKDLTAKNNSQLFFVYLPGYFHHTDNDNHSSYLSIKKIVSELDIPFIDLHAEVINKNEDSYKRAAEIIFKFTKDWKSN